MMKYRMILKLLVAGVLIALLLVLAKTTMVDFVYTGF